jgi:hypothetical protein
VSEIAEIIADLVKAGTDPELVGRVAAALAGVTDRHFVTHDVTGNVTRNVTPSAIRMRRLRERKSSENNVLDVEKTASVAVTERHTEASQGVTSYNNISSNSLSLEEDKKDIIVRSVTRKRHCYAQDFETFWGAFPTDAGMSKLEASKVWCRLTADDRLDALSSIPAFKAWVVKQGEGYRMVHACRYLSQRRFEGFKEHAATVREAPSNRVYVTTGTDAMDAWDDYFRRTKGKLAPRDQRGGWWFEAEYPPHQERAA